MNLSGQLIKGTGQFSIGELSAQDSVVKHLDKGSTYLQCDVAGTCAIPSDAGYGEFEFDLYKGGADNSSRIYFAVPGSPKSYGVESYGIFITTAEALRLVRYPAVAIQIGSADSYVNIDTWYRIKVTRTLDGEFYLYIKGGAFGNNYWTIVSAADGTGTNPRIDTTYTSSEYFVLDLDAGDRFANLTVKKKGGFLIDDPSVVSGEWIDGANSGVWDDGANSGVWSDNI